ncbi:adhesion G-protein coupled receptor G2 [Osmerus mordax]|uniref:adhesion G-protein coupled receptor G2 n=1 Tax=Osmerus mordax TaxID=8014 RepID=UPI00350F5C93
MMQFPYTGQVNELQYPVCHFFQETGEEWGWKTEGCETNLTGVLNQTLVECRCDHATPFAVLMISGPIDPVHWQILSYISYVGCGLSAFFTLSSVLLYTFNGQCKSDTSASIHVSLSGALFLLNISFLLSEWGANLDMAWVCVLIAAVMHYSLLCSFSWMALEALHLYLMLVKVFNTYYKHYMVKISILGWGVPCVIVGVSLAVTARNTLLYGLSEMAMLNTNQTNNICWIEDKTFLLSVNLAYFSMVFLFSSGVLITVSFRICSLKHYNNMSGTRDKPRAYHLPTCKDLCTVLGLSCLLGTTWGLAFLSLQNLNYTVLYLFSILNSLQGFFIFLWMWARARKESKRLAENKISTTDSSTPTKNPHH